MLVGNILSYLWTSSPQQSLQQTKTRIRKHIKTFEKEVESIHRQDVRSQNLRRIKNLSLHDAETQPKAEKTTETVSRKTISTISMFKNYAFTGRDDELDSLYHKFFPNDQPNSQNNVQAFGTPICCVLHGIGGAGKTQTALEYTYRYREDYDAMFWLSAERDPELAASFALIALKLGLVEDDGTNDAGEKHNQAKAIQEARTWLQQSGASLTILILVVDQHRQTSNGFWCLIMWRI